MKLHTILLYTSLSTVVMQAAPPTQQIHTIEHQQRTQWETLLDKEVEYCRDVIGIPLNCVDCWKNRSEKVYCTCAEKIFATMLLAARCDANLIVQQKFSRKFVQAQLAYVTRSIVPRATSGYPPELIVKLQQHFLRFLTENKRLKKVMQHYTPQGSQDIHNVLYQDALTNMIDDYLLNYIVHSPKEWWNNLLS